MRLTHAINLAAGTNFRENFRRDIEQAQQFFIPLPRMQIVEQGTRCIRCIRHVAGTAAEVPEQPAVDGAEGQFAAPRTVAGAGNMIEQPFQLGAGKIGVEQQAGLFLKQRLQSGRAQRLADVGGAPVLPDDGAMQRATAGALP